MCNQMRKCFLGLLALASMIQLTGSSHAQNATERPLRPNINAILAELNAEPWQVRRKAFYELLGGFDYQTWLTPSKLEAVFQANPDRTGELKMALIGLLSFENANQKTAIEEFRRTGETVTEEYTDYYGDLIAAVKALKDPRAVNALVGAMGTGGMAVGAILDFGPQALDLVIEKSKSPDLLERAPAISTLGAMLSLEHIDKFDNASRQKIKVQILRAATDVSWAVRVSVARILATIPNADKEAVEVLKKLAASDQAVLRGQGENGADRFPVRQAAEKALRDIEKARSPASPGDK